MTFMPLYQFVFCIHGSFHHMEIFFFIIRRWACKVTLFSCLHCSICPQIFNISLDMHRMFYEKAFHSFFLIALLWFVYLGSNGSNDNHEKFKHNFNMFNVQ